MSNTVDKLVLHSYLKKLHLSAFIANHEAFAAEAVQKQEGYTRYLLALAEQEVQERSEKHVVVNVA